MFVVLKGFYNKLENTNIDCIQEIKCFVEPFKIPDYPNSYQFLLPNMRILFSIDNNKITFQQAEFYRENKAYDFMVSINTELESPVIVNYNTQSIGEIDFNITKEEANQILTLTSSEKNVSQYKGGFSIVWNEEGKAKEIIVNNRKGKVITTNNKNAQLSIGKPLPIGREMEYLKGIYNVFENTNIDCFKEKKCKTLQTQYPNLYIFLLPKMGIAINIEKGYIIESVNFELDKTNYNTLVLNIPDTQNQEDSETEDKSQEESYQTQEESLTDYKLTVED